MSHSDPHHSQPIQQLPAFAVIQDDDRRGALWIAAILSLVFVSMTLGARLYVRKRMLGRDDYASMAAFALAVAQYASLFAGMPSGLGTSRSAQTPVGNQRKIASIFLTSQAVFICGLYMAKLAVLLATERLLAADMKAVKKVCLGIRVLLGLAALASLLLITVRCSVDGLLRTTDERRCTGLAGRWLMVTILDAVTELFILALFYGIVWSLQMRLQRKWMLTTLLGLRIACPVFIAIYTSAIKSYATSTDPGVQVMSPLVWQQITLCYSLMSALVIALVPFIRSFHTGTVMNVHNMSNMEWGSASGERRPPPRGYKLKTLSRLSRSGGDASHTGGGTGGTMTTGSSTSRRRRHQQNQQLPQRLRLGVVPLSEAAATRSTSRLAQVPSSRSDYYADEDKIGSVGVGGGGGGDYGRGSNFYSSSTSSHYLGNGVGSGSGNENGCGSGCGNEISGDAGNSSGNYKAGSGINPSSSNDNPISSSSNNNNDNNNNNITNSNSGSNSNNNNNSSSNNNNSSNNSNSNNNDNITNSNSGSSNPNNIDNPDIGKGENVVVGDLDDGQQYREGMVIQKTMDWSVQYEEGEAGGLQHPGLPRCLF